MKVSALLEDWPSGYKYKEDGNAKPHTKALELGLYTTNATNIEIFDRQTNETIKVVEDVQAVKLKDLIKADFTMSKDILNKALVNVVYDYKMSLYATRGNNPGRYVVSYEVIQ